MLDITRKLLKRMTREEAKGIIHQRKRRKKREEKDKEVVLWVLK